MPLPVGRLAPVHQPRHLSRQRARLGDHRPGHQVDEEPDHHQPAHQDDEDGEGAGQSQPSHQGVDRGAGDEGADCAGANEIPNRTKARRSRSFNANGRASDMRSKPRLSLRSRTS